MYDVGPVTVSVNGLARLGVALPFAVMVNALVLLSMNVVDWQVSRDVPEIAVNGDVGGVKALVYTAVPLTIRKLEIDPNRGLLALSPPMVRVPVEKSVEFVTDCATAPLMYSVSVVPFLTNAK